MENIFSIFKRTKPNYITPTPIFEDNWKQKQFEQNIEEGLLSLQKGKSINIYDDGRGYELAYEIKRRFILKYQKQLSEKIKIEGTNLITVSWNPIKEL